MRLIRTALVIVCGLAGGAFAESRPPTPGPVDLNHLERPFTATGVGKAVTDSVLSRALRAVFAKTGRVAGVDAKGSPCAAEIAYDDRGFELSAHTSSSRIRFSEPVSLTGSNEYDFAGVVAYSFENPPDGSHQRLRFVYLYVPHDSEFPPSALVMDVRARRGVPTEIQMAQPEGGGDAYYPSLYGFQNVCTLRSVSR